MASFTGLNRSKKTGKSVTRYVTRFFANSCNLMISFNLKTSQKQRETDLNKGVCLGSSPPSSSLKKSLNKRFFCFSRISALSYELNGFIRTGKKKNLLV
jgi:hypothetical protein